MRLTLHTANLGLVPREKGYPIAEIAHGFITVAPVVITGSVVDILLQDLPHNTTFVLQLTSAT